MPMTDGNPTQEIKATVDPVAVAQLVRQMQKQDAAASEKKESLFQNKIKSLLETGSVDKENLGLIADLIETKSRDLKGELVSESGQVSIQAMQSRYSEAVADALEKYIEGDDKLERKVKTFQFEALEKLAAKPEVMAKFNAGQLDKRQINAAAKEVVEEYSKETLGRDKSSKGPVMNQQVPGSVAAHAIENSSPAGSIDEIAEPHRREAYFKLNALFKRNKMAPEDAHKKAFAAATRQYKKAGSAA